VIAERERERVYNRTYRSTVLLDDKKTEKMEMLMGATQVILARTWGTGVQFRGLIAVDKGRIAMCV
jgi:hypothetical protein